MKFNSVVLKIVISIAVFANTLLAQQYEQSFNLLNQYINSKDEFIVSENLYNELKNFDKLSENQKNNIIKKSQIDTFKLSRLDSDESPLKIYAKLRPNQKLYYLSQNACLFDKEFVSTEIDNLSTISPVCLLASYYFILQNKKKECLSAHKNLKRNVLKAMLLNITDGKHDLLRKIQFTYILLKENHETEKVKKHFSYSYLPLQLEDGSLGIKNSAQSGFDESTIYFYLILHFFK